MQRARRRRRRRDRHRRLRLLGAHEVEDLTRGPGVQAAVVARRQRERQDALIDALEVDRERARPCPSSRRRRLSASGGRVSPFSSSLSRRNGDGRSFFSTARFSDQRGCAAVGGRLAEAVLAHAGVVRREEVEVLAARVEHRVGRPRSGRR